MTDQTNQPKERPIIFSDDMVRAILDGKKTQTRQVIKQPVRTDYAKYTDADFDIDGDAEWELSKTDDLRRVHIKIGKCPYGKVGDRLWVREAHTRPDFLEDYEASEINQGLITLADIGVSYKADAPYARPADGGWRSPVAMPRWASRLLLEITDIHVERLQDITVSQAQKNGCPNNKDLITIRKGFHDECENIMNWFKSYWDSKNPNNKYKSNPWVWVISFKAVEGV